MTNDMKDEIMDYFKEHKYAYPDEVARGIKSKKMFLTFDLLEDLVKEGKLIYIKDDRDWEMCPTCKYIQEYKGGFICIDHSNSDRTKYYCFADGSNMGNLYAEKNLINVAVKKKDVW